MTTQKNSSFFRVSDGKTVQQEVDDIIKEVDNDGDGVINFQEFLQASLNKKAHFNSKNVKALFKFLDTNGDGVITMEELKEQFQTSNSQTGFIEQIIEEVDENGDGKIDPKEFSKAITKFL